MQFCIIFFQAAASFALISIEEKVKAQNAQNSMESKNVAKWINFF